jgi:hypothetical protein
VIPWLCIFQLCFLGGVNLHSAVLVKPVSNRHRFALLINAPLGETLHFTLTNRRVKLRLQNITVVQSLACNTVQTLVLLHTTMEVLTLFKHMTIFLNAADMVGKLEHTPCVILGGYPSFLVCLDALSNLLNIAVQRWFLSSYEHSIHHAFSFSNTEIQLRLSLLLH